MAYVAVVKALYDYTAQDTETELSFTEDQIIYVIEKEDDDWWKGKLKDGGDAESSVGLIPATYVEELPPLNTTKAIYAYESTSPEEHSMEEDSLCHVYSIEDDWLLVRIDGIGSNHLGFVPRNYCEPMDASEQVEVPDAAEAEAEVEHERQREQDEKLRKMRLQDKVETWSVSEVDGKKKKKGTLGVGNGAVFFASDTDKMTPVKQYPITDLSSVSQPSNKDIHLSLATLSSPLHLHCGSADEARAILAKLESSKHAAGEALETLAADSRTPVAPDSEDEDQGYAAPEPKAVRFAPPTSPAAGKGGETATVLYDFDAQGDDELSVKENEIINVLDKENDEWWLVRNNRNKEGVVPAQYVQINDGTEPSSAAGHGTQAYAEPEEDSEDERIREAEAAEAAAALEAERSRQKEERAAQRRAIEKAAAEKRAQEDEDHRMALELEQREIEKQRRREAKERQKREHDVEQRREAARSMEPPKISKRPSAQDVAAAAANLPSRGRSAPERPPENNRPRPNSGRIRVWSDKSGQFRVEAEYLGLNGNKIRLHKTNGVIIDVPLDKMSTEDVQMIRRHEARKRQQAMEAEDDAPLATSRSRDSRRQTNGNRSEETRSRGEEPIPAAAMEKPKPRKPKFDWFAFFLDAGCDIDDSTRYATNFERDRIEEDILPELERSTMRNLGLKEGDVIRVKKAIDIRTRKPTAEESEQIKIDEDYARKLQEHINSGSKGPAPQPPPSLFTGPGGKLANNTRRGRPDKKSSGTDTVDASAIAAASDQLSKMNTGDHSPSPPPITVSAAKTEKPAPLITGFDDDAWTIKPSTSKPASPAPPPAAPPAPATSTASPPANTTESLLAQIQALRPAATGIPQNNTGNSSFDRLAAIPQNQNRSPIQNPSQFQNNNNNSMAYGLGQQNTGQPMNALMQNGPRGPIAPVAQNETLLNPMQPSMTGMFVPTRGASPGMGMMAQQTGYQPQQQQQQQQPMMSQPTGYAQGFQQGYGQGGYGAPQQQIQPNFTGYPGGMQPQPQSSFNAIANIGPPQPQQQQRSGDKFAPQNIFAAMKKTDFAKPEEQRPQDAGKYDALRPLTTGYNGGPPGMMMPQQTGIMMQPQQQQQQMGMMGGMMNPQMTGYNPYAGQQQGFGYR